MLSRRSRELLLTMRKVGELEARRAVVDAEAALALAIEREERAQAARLKAAARATPLPLPLRGRAARFVARAEFFAQVRSDCDDAQRAHRAAAQDLAAHGDGLDDARGALASAMRAREMAERAAQLARVALERAQTRREEAAFSAPRPVPTDERRWRRRRKS